MLTGRLESVARAATAVSAIVGVATFAVYATVIYWQVNADRVREWQAVVAYSIVAKGPREGLTYEEIKRRYLDEVQTFADFEIPKKEIQDGALTRVLWQLHAQHVIERDVDGAYAIQAAMPFRFRPRMDEAFERNQKMIYATDKIIAKIQAHNCAYTKDQLQLELQGTIDLPQDQFLGLITYLVAQGMLRIGPKERLCSFGGPLPLPQSMGEPPQLIQ